MANIPLLLGPVLFQDFELPQQIGWGGKQRLYVHQLPGGTRVIDAMGRDDADIVWSGIFTGTDAGLRARTLDLLRAQGGVWPLTWDTFFYSVVIARFEAEYRKPNWIPYRIVCKVLRDEAEAIIDDALSLAASLVSDLASASSYGVDTSASATALAAPDATVLSTSAYGSASTALAATIGSTTAAFNAVDAGFGASPANAAALGATADAAGTLANLATANQYLARASVNLANAST